MMMKKNHGGCLHEILQTLFFSLSFSLAPSLFFLFRLPQPGPIFDTPKFSARYKSGDSAASLAAYRKNLRKNEMREKPPFYTPTTPPITTQVVSVSRCD